MKVKSDGGKIVDSQILWNHQGQVKDELLTKTELFECELPTDDTSPVKMTKDQLLPKFTRGRPDRPTSLADIRKINKAMIKLDKAKNSGILDIKSKPISKEVKEKKHRKKNKKKTKEDQEELIDSDDEIRFSDEELNEKQRTTVVKLAENKALESPRVEPNSQDVMKQSEPNNNDATD